MQQRARPALRRPARHTETTPRLAVAVVLVMVMAMMTRIVPMAEFAMIRRVMKAAIAVTMVEALRLCCGHAQSQCGNQCQCKQFF